MKLGKSALTSFLTGFGPGVGDLRLTAQQMSLSGTVALPTHLLHTTVSATVEDSGEIVISDLPKVLTFIKTLPQDALITLWQPKNSTLRLICGQTELRLPTTDHVMSHKSAKKALLLIEDARRAHWKSWAGKPLTCYARLQGSDLQQVKSMEKVIGKGVPFKMTFNVEDKMLVFDAGHKSSAAMSTAIDMEDCTMDIDEDPTKGATSHYGPWLPHILGGLPTGPVELYTANDFVSIYRHVEKDYLLLVMDKRGE